MNILIFDHAGILAKKKQQMHATFAKITDQVRYGVEDFFVSQKKSDLCFIM